MNRPRFAIRTVRGQTVLINGRIFRCDAPVPDHLDGTRAAFALYWNGDEMQPYVALWGSEAEYRDPDKAWPGAWCDADGYFRWQTWREVTS